MVQHSISFTESTTWKSTMIKPAIINCLFPVLLRPEKSCGQVDVVYFSINIIKAFRTNNVIVAKLSVCGLAINMSHDILKVFHSTDSLFYW